MTLPVVRGVMRPVDLPERKRDPDADRLQSETDELLAKLAALPFGDET